MFLETYFVMLRVYFCNSQNCSFYPGFVVNPLGSLYLSLLHKKYDDDAYTGFAHFLAGINLYLMYAKYWNTAAIVYIIDTLDTHMATPQQIKLADMGRLWNVLGLWVS